MLTLTDIRNRRDEIEKALAKRNLQAGETLDAILKSDESRRACQSELDAVLAESNSISKEIGNLFKSGKREEAEAMKAKTVDLKERSHDLKEKQGHIDEELKQLLYKLPNVPHPTVPLGMSDEDNQVESEWGTKPVLADNAVPHWELTERYDLIDFELGVKITGAGISIVQRQRSKTPTCIDSILPR